jgi:hypothetical protein
MSKQENLRFSRIGNVFMSDCMFIISCKRRYIYKQGQGFIESD